MEKLLLGAMLLSRQNYSLIKEYIVPKKYSKEFQILSEKIGEYYERDKEVESVEPEILYHQIAESIRSEKHQQLFKDYIEAARTSDIPEGNIRDLILKSKIQEKGDELAQSLVNGGNSERLAEDYIALSRTQNLDDITTKGVEVVEEEDLEVLIAGEFDKANHLVLYPQDLNERLDGGVKGGHCIFIYGRPEAAKTATAITMACGFCRQQADGLYLGNEDRRKDLVLRFISNLSGMAKREIEKNPTKAIAVAEQEGLRRAKIIAMSPGTPQQIEALVARYRPKWVVVDQLRNLNVQNESRVNQLEAAATALRNIGKKYNCVMIGVTQAGDSGDNKAVLEMGDIDFSNTGIPAQADLLIGVGVTPALEADGKRWLNLPKNKLSGRHENFPVRIDTSLSRVMSM